MVNAKKEKRWMSDIIKYIVDGICPKDKSEARKLRMKEVRYCMLGGQLYERSFSGLLLRCLGPKQALKVIAEMHGGF